MGLFVNWLGQKRFALKNVYTFRENCEVGRCIDSLLKNYYNHKEYKGIPPKR